jgi:hypothetical protein
MEKPSDSCPKMDELQVSLVSYNTALRLMERSKTVDLSKARTRKRLLRI